MTNAPVTTSHDEADRNLAFLAYILLFFSIFFAGAPALIAAAIAYARRGDAGPLVRSHHAYQIWVFWIAFGFTLLAGVCGLFSVLGLIGEMITVAAHGRWDSWDAVSVQISDIHVSRLVVICAVFAFLMGAVAALWLVCASAYGFIRLASRRAMGQTGR